jgi:NAD+ kinase
VAPGDSLPIRSRLGAAQIVRLGQTTFYERARRKLRVNGSAEVE